MSDELHDLGHNHTFQFVSWAPDRNLNPQYKDIPDIDPMGAIINHLKPSGEE